MAEATGEFALIRQYFAGISSDSSGEGIALGIGDDAAVLSPAAGRQLVVAADTLVAGAHFPESIRGGDLARRALRVNLSDMAAMGARPRWFTLALTLPEADATWLADFSAGLKQDVSVYDCALVGGDTTRGPLTVSIQMLGDVEPGGALTRAGAKPGDSVYVTGELGAAAGALTCLANATPDEYEQALLSRYYLPQPRLAEGLLLQGIASAAIDISDGLLADLGHIAQASEVGAELYLPRIPVFKGLAERHGERRALGWALAGGDDYELCFTAAPENRPRLQQLLDSGAMQAAEIGKITAGNGIQCLDARGWVADIASLFPGGENQPTGYQHF